MADIIRIVIKGGSGYGPVDEAFSDKVTIDCDSIRYEYTPLLGIIFNGFCFINLIPHFFDYLMCPYYPALYDGLLSNCYRW